MPLANDTRVRVEGRSKISATTGPPSRCGQPAGSRLQAVGQVEDGGDGLGGVVPQRQQGAPGAGSGCGVKEAQDTVGGVYRAHRARRRGCRPRAPLASRRCTPGGHDRSPDSPTSGMDAAAETRRRSAGHPPRRRRSRSRRSWCSSAFNAGLDPLRAPARPGASRWAARRGMAALGHVRRARGGARLGPPRRRRRRHGLGLAAFAPTGLAVGAGHRAQAPRRPRGSRACRSPTA